MDRVEQIADAFKLRELILIAEELGLQIGKRWQSVRIVDAIEKYLISHGLPEIATEDDQTQGEKLLEEYLYVGRWTNEDGEPESPIPVSLPSETIADLEEFMIAAGIKRTPACFGYAKSGGVECNKCPIFRFCAAERINTLPECFGGYDKTDPQCLKCKEAPFCKRERKESNNDRTSIEG